MKMSSVRSSTTLISNSLKALVPDREGQIKLMAAAQEKEVLVTVRDNGKGMTEEEVSKALEPFYTKSINGNRAWALNREPPGGVKWRNDGDREQAGGRDRRGFKISGENGIV